MKVELNKEEIVALCKTMSEYCRHHQDPMVASEALRPLRIKLETAVNEKPATQEAQQEEV